MMNCQSHALLSEGPLRNDPYCKWLCCTPCRDSPNTHEGRASSQHSSSPRNPEFARASLFSRLSIGGPPRQKWEERASMPLPRVPVPGTSNRLQGQGPTLASQPLPPALHVGASSQDGGPPEVLLRTSSSSDPHPIQPCKQQQQAPDSETKVSHSPCSD